MHWRNGFLASGLAGLLLVQGCGNQGIMTSSSAYAPQIHTSPTGSQNAPRYSNRMVVKYRSGASDSQVRSFQQRFKLNATRDVSSLGMSVLTVPTTRNATSLMGAIQSDPAVEYVEPDFIFSVPSPVRSHVAAARATRRVQALSSNDPQLSRQWGLPKIGMPQLWPFDAGSPNVVVAVVDTGVDVSHPDLRSQLVPGYSVLANSSGPNDDHGHGTHVAGIIAAALNNATGGSGVAPHCRIMPVKVLGHDGKGDTGDIVTGILWAVNNGAKVINLSLGGTGGSRALMDAVNYAESKDVVVVAAMGNDGKNSQEYPAGYAGVIAVGATDEDDKVADFSNYGSWISVCAPGVNILSTLPTHDVTVNTEEGKDTDYDVMDGTSMATPFVSGVAALIRSQFPGMSAAAVKARIEATADDLGDPGFDSYYGHGRINAYRAIFGK